MKNDIHTQASTVEQAQNNHTPLQTEQNTALKKDEYDALDPTPQLGIDTDAGVSHGYTWQKVRALWQVLDEAGLFTSGEATFQSYFYNRCSHLCIGYNPNDLLQALKNYVEVLNNPDTAECYKHKKMLGNLLQSAMFEKLLPQVFDIQAFLDFKKQKQNASNVDRLTGEPKIELNVITAENADEAMAQWEAQNEIQNVA